MRPSNPEYKDRARVLRSGMTDAEQRLWGAVRMRQLLGFQFYRQKSIGDYIVDFYCPKASLVIELDGGQHYTEAGKKKDEVRDLYLAESGLRVLRFSNREVFEELEGVIGKVMGHLARFPRQERKVRGGGRDGLAVSPLGGERRGEGGGGSAEG